MPSVGIYLPSSINYSPTNYAAPRGFARLDLVDALRGSALLGILLLHAIEHWDFMSYPEGSPELLNTLNTWTVEAGVFFFSGKAYAIFALLFGLSFHLILERWSQRGINFQSRFLWRLFVLAVMGYLHGIIYCGDILLVIAALGVPLVFLHRLDNRPLAWISIALFLQIPTLFETGRVLLHPNYFPADPRHWATYDHLFEVYSKGSFLDVTTTNLWQGQQERIWWTIETGRSSQMLGLFLCGLLLGRSGVLHDSQRLRQLAKRTLLLGAIGFLFLFPLKLLSDSWGLHGTRHYVAHTLISSYCNLAQTAVWAGSFVLLYEWAKAKGVLRHFVSSGRMSLTCYITQGMIGVPLFYGYGFALHRSLGPFFSVFVGAGIFALQALAAQFWLKRFAFGPFEYIWRVCTQGSLGTSIRRAQSASLVEHA